MRTVKISSVSDLTALHQELLYLQKYSIKKIKIGLGKSSTKPQYFRDVINKIHTKSGNETLPNLENFLHCSKRV